MNMVDIFIVFEEYLLDQAYLINIIICNLLNLQKAGISLISIDIRARSLESTVFSA